MPFSTCNLLSSIKSTFQATFRGLGRLTIQDRGAWLTLLSRFQSYSFTQQVVQAFPSAVCTSQAKIVINSFPRWQIARQHPPRTTTLQDIENPIQNPAPAMFSRTTGLRFGWQVWSDFQPLSIIQVSWVNLLRFGHPTSLPNLFIFR